MTCHAISPQIDSTAPGGLSRVLLLTGFPMLGLISIALKRIKSYNEGAHFAKNLYKIVE